MKQLQDVNVSRFPIWSMFSSSDFDGQSPYIFPMTSHQHHQRIFQLKKTIPSTNIDPAN